MVVRGTYPILPLGYSPTSLTPSPPWPLFPLLFVLFVFLGNKELKFTCKTFPVGYYKHFEGSIMFMRPRVPKIRVVLGFYASDVTSGRFPANWPRGKSCHLFFLNPLGVYNKYPKSNLGDSKVHTGGGPSPAVYGLAAIAQPRPQWVKSILHSFVSHSHLLCSIVTPHHSPKLLFTPSIHLIFGLPLDLPPIASDPVILFTIRPLIHPFYHLPWTNQIL